VIVDLLLLLPLLFWFLVTFVWFDLLLCRTIRLICSRLFVAIRCRVLLLRLDFTSVAVPATTFRCSFVTFLLV